MDHGLAVNPGSVALNTLSAYVLRQPEVGEYGLALERARAALGRWPGFVSAEFQAGVAATKVGEFEAAGRYLAAVSGTFGHRDAMFHVAVGELYERTGRPRRAKEQYGEALRISGGEPEAAGGLARMEREIERTGAATKPAEAEERGLALDPSGGWDVEPAP